MNPKLMVLDELSKMLDMAMLKKADKHKSKGMPVPMEAEIKIEAEPENLMEMERPELNDEDEGMSSELAKLYEKDEESIG
jgi:hypothetical protein